MTKKRGKKPVEIVPLSPSPLKNRSGFVRKTVRWSPQVELQNVINKANVSLSMPNLKRTPIPKVISKKREQ